MDKIWIFRTDDGGGLYYFLAQVNNATSTYTDSTVDSGLNDDIVAPLNPLNAPPPTGANLVCFWSGRLWVAVKNILYFAMGPDCTTGVGEEAFIASNQFKLPLNVTGFGSHMYGRYIDLQSAKKDAQVASLTQTVEQDKQSVASLASQAAQEQSTYQATLTAMQAQNAQLAQTIAQESAALSKVQAVDKTLPLPQLGQRMETLVPDAKGGVTATATGLALNDAASRGVVSQLEEVPVLKDQLSQETQTAANNADMLTKAQTTNTACQSEVAGLNKSLTDQQAHEAAVVAADKVKIKKAWRSGFKWGAITTAVGGIAIKLFTAGAL